MEFFTFWKIPDMFRILSAAIDANDDYVPEYNISKKTFVPRKIFVGYLPLGISHEDLKNHFIRFGAVKFAKICRGRQSVYSNYGFVEFAKQDSVKKAIEACKANKIYMKRNKLYVVPAFYTTVTDAAVEEDAESN
ncbi:hypothetical protein TNCV_407301 [Trichonephila clavipes]|nr:hypothetical protein TNCV_407301 [Trichonephila clavipes]